MIVVNKDYHRPQRPASVK